MIINDLPPVSGRLVGEDNQIHNVVDLLGGGTPVSGKTVNVGQMSPRSGRVVGEDNRVYNLVDLLSGGAGDTYTKAEIDNKISAIVQEIDWKEAVATFADLATTYPDAEEGWTASVKDTDKVYRYNGTAWVDIYILPPIATASNDGLMSAQQVQALNGKVDAVAGKGLSTEDYTAAEKTKLANIEVEANKTIVDSAMSASSTNPVQNKVVKQYVDSKSVLLTVTLTNSAEYPFNNSKTTVAFANADVRENTNYIVIPEVTAHSGGDVGDIIISDKMTNGFKAEHTGSATSVSVMLCVTGGV